MWASPQPSRRRAAGIDEAPRSLAGGARLYGKSSRRPSRWSTERSGEWEPFRPELVVEVRYDHVTGDQVSPWYQADAVASRQGPAPMHLRTDRAAAR